MDIWEILHIGPTADKKAIRRAYAARTRVIHPEEKPEEFKQLHEAYQSALKYAEFALKRERDFVNIVKSEAGENGKDSVNDNDEVSTADVSSGQENTGHAELLSFFTENQEKQQQRVDAFMQHWRDLKNISDDPKVYEWWQEYLSSDDFQNIRWNAQVLRLLIEEIDNKFFYGTNEVKMLFWNAYGFRENDEDKYQGESQKLWKCLYQAYEYYEKVFLAKEWDRKSKRAFYFFWAGVFVCVLFICIVALGYNKNKRENDQQLILQYMAERYPGIAFSTPEQSRQQETRGVAYNFHSSNHPDILITAKMEYDYPDGKRIGQVTEEDYGSQILEYYAAQYGLKYGQLEYERREYREDGYYSQEKELCNVLYYPDIGQLDTFCETVIRMFDEQEELQVITSVGICAENILYPNVLLQGGALDFLVVTPQIYDLRNADQQELTEQLERAYIFYMFQYEPWNVTLEQCGEWGSVYQEACRQWQNYPGIWYDITDLDTGEVLCTLYASTYMRAVDRYSGSYYEELVTVGNAYDLLQLEGVDVTVNEDGRGFIAQIDGQTVTFGSEPEVRLDKLGTLPEEIQNIMQNNFFILE